MGNVEPIKCYHVWKGIYFAPQSKITPCCRFLYHDPKLEIDPGKAPHEQPIFHSLKKQMLSGMAPTGCERCFTEEKYNVLSKRLRTNLSKPQFEIPDSTESDHAEITHIDWHLGNLCNLRCITCAPVHSSSWNIDAQSAGYDPQPTQTTDVNLIKPYINSLEKLLIVGGEPIINNQFVEIIELIEKANRSSFVEITVSTNLTIYPNEHVLRILSRFKKVRLEISIDAIEQRNEFIRYPSKWPILNSHVSRLLAWSTQFENVDVILTTVVSAYSLGGIQDLLDWWVEKLNAADLGPEPKYLFLNYLKAPWFQSANVLPMKTRELIIEKFSKENPYYEKLASIKDLILKSNDNETAGLISLKSWTEKIDQNRTLKSKDVIPEIYFNF